jgi:hypothetical protein
MAKLALGRADVARRLRFVGTRLSPHNRGSVYERPEAAKQRAEGHLASPTSNAAVREDERALLRLVSINLSDLIRRRTGCDEGRFELPAFTRSNVPAMCDGVAHDISLRVVQVELHKRVMYYRRSCICNNTDDRREAIGAPHNLGLDNRNIAGSANRLRGSAPECDCTHNNCDQLLQGEHLTRFIEKASLLTLTLYIGVV